MKVAWLFEYPTLLGGERSLLATLPYLLQAGIEPVALAPPEGPLADVLAGCGVEHRPFNVHPSDRAMSRQQLRQALRSLLEEIRPALLHANSLSMGRLSAAVVEAAGMPSIAHLRDVVGLSAAAVADLNRHARLLAVSQATREFHLKQGVSAERTRVCHNGVDLNLFRPRAPTGWLHRELGLPDDAVLAASIGQLVMRKGHDVLARAAARVKDRLPALHWLLVGERHSQKAEAIEYEAALRASIEAAGLARRFHFLGAIVHVERVLPEVTLLVHPARQEPLGRVLLEAAAACVACIATDVGGTREVFPAATMARLVPANNVDSLAEAIVELIESPAEREAMGRSARRRMEEAFGAEHAARALAGHYREVSDGQCP
ncbi:MAG TPA: glycosyltransferase [Pirellulales bacterium]|nr:glycosyltransferase [Pirellulales bacterium]